MILDYDSGLERMVVSKELNEQNSPLSQHAHSLLSPLVVLASPTNTEKDIYEVSL